MHLVPRAGPVSLAFLERGDKIISVCSWFPPKI